MRYVAVLFAASCGFGSPVKPATEIDAPSIDAAPPGDEALPGDMTMPLPVCGVGVTTTPGTDRGRVGGNGGGDNFPPLRCNAAADRIVGIGIRMSNQNTLFGVRSAHGFSIACATVTVDPNTGTGTTGTPYTKEIVGNGQQGWDPSTLFAPTMCPAGTVVNGLRAKTGGGQNIFSNVDFWCAKLDGANAATLSSQMVHVNGSQNDNQNEKTANCGANEIVYEMANRTGNGFDSVNLFCAPATCIPPAS